MGHILFSDLWSKRIPIILTSGTLSALGSFEYIKKSLGLELVAKKRLTETSKPSPFNYKENCLLYISETVPFPDNKNPEYINSLADEISDLIETAHGHTAVLFTSYKVMDLVFEKVKQSKTGYPLFKLNKGGGNSINLFKQSKNGVVFATGSMWEGIDIPGDILSSVIITKLPFEVPDPISEYEQTQYESIEAYIELVVFPKMIVKLKQGFGRLIRALGDNGVVSILDYRVRIKGTYRKRVLAALPDCRFTNKVVDVAEFFKRKKNREYFY